MKLFKKILSLLLVLSVIIQLAACGTNPSVSTKGLKEKAGEIGGKIADTAENVIDGAEKIISNLSLPHFKRGFEITAGYFGATLASIGGQAYVDNVASAIDDLQKRLVNRVSPNGKVASQAGYVAEEWHAGTYNIDAAARGSAKRAETLQSTGLGSVDIAVGDEIKASAKYYKTAEESAKAQATNYLKRYGEYQSKSTNPKTIDEWLLDNGLSFSENRELYLSIYEDQLRIIPADQLKDAQKFLSEAIKREKAKGVENRTYVAETDLETLRNLTDRLSTADGTESIPLSKAEAEAIVKTVRDDGMDVEQLSTMGVSVNSAITGAYVAKQALKSGATAAIIEAAIVLGPEIYDLIQSAIESGEIDEEQLKKAGIDGLTAAGDGFLKGSISNALVILLQAGKLGAEFKNASPELVGTLTVLIIDGIRYGIMMSNGQISTVEYLDIMAEEVFVSAGALGTATLIGLLFPGAALAIILGSFVGGLMFSAGYAYGKPYALALIGDCSVNLLVPITEKASVLEDFTETVSIKVSDALAGLKKISSTAYDTVTIKVYDLTSIV